MVERFFPSVFRAIAPRVKRARGIRTFEIEVDYGSLAKNGMAGLIDLPTSRHQLDSGEKISSELVVARGDAAVMLDFVEEALDEIALAIKHEITVARHLAVGLWRDHWNDGPPIEAVDQRIGVVSLVADEGARISRFE